MTESTLPKDYIRITDFEEAGGTADWRVLGDGASAFYRTDSLAMSARLVDAIAALPAVEDHRPDVDIRPDGVTVRLLTTELWFGLSRRDIQSARGISAAATALGLRADPSLVQCLHPIVIGAMNIAAVMPFWEALTGYVRRPDSPDQDLIDPRGRGPGIWFEEVDDASETRPRMHFAVWVPFEQAQARVDAVIAAGGRLIFDRAAPAWWTLADAEGNEADVATTKNRD